MATTFFLFELGFAPVIDTVEGNQTSENHNALNGLSFGSANDPVYADLRTLSPAATSGPGTDGDATSYNANNNVANERFTIDGSLRTFDALMTYSNTVITYTDGTTAIVEALVMQDTDGRVYLIPSASGPNAYTDALEAKPIASVTLGTALPANGTDVYGMYADRFVLDINDETVEGTAGGDLIDAGYVGDPDGDRIDNGDNFAGDNDDLIEAYGGNDTVIAGAGDDSVYGGDGADVIHGDTVASVDAVLVAEENFEGGASGWTNNTTTSGGQFGTFLGRFEGTDGNSSGGPLTQKTFDLAGGFNSVVVEFDLYILDSWDANGDWSTGPDGDAFQLYVNGSQVANQLFSNVNPGFTNNRTGTITLGGVDYTYSFDLVSADTNLGFGSFNDQIWRVRLEAENYTGDQITIGFGSTTDEDVNNESFGIDNFSLVSTNDTTIDIANVGGADLLFGGAGNDTIYGGAEDDTLSGNAGADLIDGGDGADQIQGGQGSDTITAGDGNDFVLGDGQWYTVGDYASVTDGAATTLTVTNSADGPIQLWWIDETGSMQLYATIQPGQTYVQSTFVDHNWVLRDEEGYYLELIEGAANQTVTYGAEGLGDSISGGDGADTIRGQFGNDSISGGSGADLIYGGSGNDSVLGDADNDTIYGGTGADSLFGGTGLDLIYGGDGNDSLNGGGDADTLHGDAGDDSIAGNTGNDVLYGGEGNDTLDGDSDNDTLYGDAGNDRLIGDAGDDLLYGGDGADSMTGGDGTDVLHGDAGLDTLNGGNGNDTLYGGADADRLTAGVNQGSDVIYGGETGDDYDTLNVSGADNVTVTFTGNEQGTYAYQSGGDGTFFEIENVETGIGDDTIDASTTTSWVVVQSGAGDDVILLGSGDDAVTAGDGNDTVSLGGGADIVFGGTGSDTFLVQDGFGGSYIDGGAGDWDLLDLSALTNGVQVVFTGPNAGTITDLVTGEVMSFENIGHLILTEQADVVDASLDDGSTYIETRSGNDSLTGSENGATYDDYAFDPNGQGNDTYVGGAGNDTLWMGTDDDLAYGGGGADFVNGQEGSDTLYGGAGNDTLNGGFDSDLIDGGDGDDLLEGDYAVGGAVIGNGDTVTGTAGQDSGVFDGAAGSAATVILDDGSGTANDGDDVRDVVFVDVTGDGASLTVQGFDYGIDWITTAEPWTASTVTEIAPGNHLVTLTYANGNTQSFDVFHDNGSTFHIDDAFAVHAGDDTLEGGEGNDTLLGMDGDDRLFGGLGNDTVEGGRGDDLLSGGDGTDTAVFTGPVTDYSFDYGPGGELIVTDNVADRDGQDTLDGFEYVEFGGVTYHLVTGDDGSNTTLQGPDDGTPTLIIAHEGNDWGGGHDTSDVVFGGAGDDTLDGGNGNDTLIGEEGNDLLRGDAGDDQLFGGSGSDTLQGGTGDDLIALGSDGEGDVIVFADGHGSDTITGFDAPIDNGDGTFTGVDLLDVSGLTDADGYPVKVPSVVVSDDGRGNAVLTFPSGESLTLIGIDPAEADNPAWLEALGIPQIGPVDGTAGDDVMTPTSGVGGGAYTDTQGDQVDGSDGLNDTIYGYAGNDSISGGASDDLVYGGDDNDTLNGNSGQDTLYGGIGDDSLSGGTGDDVLHGEEGADILAGQEGDDTLYGGDGNDTITGFEGSDSVFGGAGDDVINTRTSPGTGIPDEGYGFVYPADTDPANDTDFVDGGDGNDSILTGDDNDTVLGGLGNDTIDAGFDDDLVDGGAGADSIEGNEGNDTIDGGDDNDIIYGDVSPDNPDYGAYVPFELPNDGTDLAPGNNADSLSGGAGNDTIYGQDDDDTIDGGEGDDLLYGGIDNDRLFGGLGNDTVEGGRGDDLLSGGDGTDTAVFTGPVTDYSFDYGPGGELIVTDNVADRDGQDTLDGFEYVEFGGVTYHLVTGDDGSNTTLQGPDDGTPTLIIAHEGNDWGGGHDTSDVVFGGAGDDTLDGGNGNDTLIGEEGNDLLRGDAGDDQLFGGSGSDTLQGGEGNDTLDAGTGADTVKGGAGADVIALGSDGEGDVIVFADGHGSDTITGFDAPIDNGDGTFTGVDLLDVSGLTDGNGAIVNTGDVTVTDTNGDGTGDAVLTFPNGESLTLVGVDPTTAFDPAWLEALGIPAADYVVSGTAGNDLIDAGYTGDPEGDVVDGTDAADGSQDDEIRAGDGSDTVFAGEGDDLVSGGIGFDSLYGGAGNDTLQGEENDDQLFGGDGDDLLEGGEGLDYLEGGAGSDTLYGGTDGSADQLYGGDGNDLIGGEAGDDTITGGTGADTLYGGDGADRITFDSGDSVHGDAGDDLLVLEDLGETGDVYVDGGDDGESAGGGDTLDLGFLADRSTTVITSTTTNASGNTSYSGSVQMDNGSMLFFEGIENIICFTPGTRIATAKGPVPVERLKKGDLVVTRDNGLQPVRWIEQRTVPGRGKLAPVRIDRSVLAGQERDLIVSPQHRVLFEGYRAELLFGESEVLASAVHLVDGHAVRRERVETVTYVHFLLDRHEIVFAEGAATESFHPGELGLDAVGAAAREELFAIFPELRADPSVYGQSARRCLKRFEAALILG